MSLPTEIDWAIIKIGNDADPVVYTAICGLQDVNINMTANTNDRFRRDCTALGAIPYRSTRTTGMQMDITGTGFSNADQFAALSASLGKVLLYSIETYADDGTDAGDPLGNISGNFVMTAANFSTSRDGDSSMEVTLSSHGEWIDSF